MRCDRALVDPEYRFFMNVAWAELHRDHRYIDASITPCYASVQPSFPCQRVGGQARGVRDAPHPARAANSFWITPAQRKEPPALASGWKQASLRRRNRYE